MTTGIKICEVSPRDGLQGECHIPTSDFKVGMVNNLVKAGMNYVEVGSFVSPKAVPAMAQTGEVFGGLDRSLDTKFTALVLNDKGFERALAAEVDGICVVMVVSESLCQKNNGVRPAEALNRARNIIRQAKDRNLFVRLDIAPAWVCPYDGPVPISMVERAVLSLAAEGVDEVALCDTIGAASPEDVSRLIAHFLPTLGEDKLAVHLHDTQGLGLANAYAALAAGCRIFDSSAAGLGGCPFAKGARGNLATEDLVLLCHKLGYSTGVDLSKLHKVVGDLEVEFERSLGGGTRSFWQSLTQEKKDAFNC